MYNYTFMTEFHCSMQSQLTSPERSRFYVAYRAKPRPRTKPVGHAESDDHAARYAEISRMEDDMNKFRSVAELAADMAGSVAK